MMMQTENEETVVMGNVVFPLNYSARGSITLEIIVVSVI